MKKNKIRIEKLQHLKEVEEDSIVVEKDETSSVEDEKNTSDAGDVFYLILISVAAIFCMLPLFGLDVKVVAFILSVLSFFVGISMKKSYAWIWGFTSFIWLIQIV